MDKSRPVMLQQLRLTNDPEQTSPNLDFESHQQYVLLEACLGEWRIAWPDR